MTHISVMQKRGRVELPVWKGERHYMIPFQQRQGLPDFIGRFQPAVDAMLAGIETKHDIYIMIDESEVFAGRSQRRPGVHVDGYWIDGKHSQHRGRKLGAHAWDRSGVHAPHRGSHAPKPAEDKHSPARHSAGASWHNPDWTFPEAIVLASNVSSARAYIGEYSEQPGEGGDYSHLDVSGLGVVNLDAGHVYAGNVCMLHESLPVRENVKRTLVRLNVPGWTPRVH